MTGPELVYLFAVGMYLVLFVLFSRFFFWKTYSEGTYWKKRPNLSLARVRKMAEAASLQLPYFSVVIPARNEADVIEKTLQHMGHLRYDPDRFEVIVVTDEKEQMQNNEQQKHFVLDTAQFLDYALDGEWSGPAKQHVQTMVLGLLTRLCLQQYQNPELHAEHWVLPSCLKDQAPRRSQQLLFDIVTDILRGNGRVNINRLFKLFRRFYVGLDDRHIMQIYPNYLCLAVPIVQLYANWTADNKGALMRNMIRYSARANHRITQEIVSSLATLVGQTVHQQVAEMVDEGSIKAELNAVYTFCYPTTQNIVEQVQLDWQGRERMPTLKHVIVPYDFDGIYRGELTGKTVPSTKGRALNYAVPIAVSEQTDMCAFYDAESRPERDSLLYVAYKRLLRPDNPIKIFQGPVFQVRNFYEMGPFCKIACLYQAIAHDWYLPIVFRRLPFVGGTNLYIEYKLLDELSGYDPVALTEDLELGTRAYLHAGAWPEYLPYASSEQTPASYRSFYRQRLRWGTGHLQVMDKILSDKEYPAERKKPLLKELLIKGPIEWSFYQCATLIPPIILILWWLGQVDPNVVPEMVRRVLNFLSLVYVSFTFYAFFRYRKHLDQTAKPVARSARCAVVAQLLALPLAAFFFPLPFTSALVLKRINRHPTSWTKTPRTKE